MTVEIPKPGPVVPLAAVSGAGVNQDSVEARSRIVSLVLPHAKDAIRSTEDVLTIAEWILLGPDEEVES